MTHDPAPREEQLAYSELMDRMLDEEGRRTKAAKIIAVVRHALGVQDLSGLRALDVGCSAGFIADELAQAGARTSGVDIDEPGLATARERFGDRVDFRVARGEALPFEDGSMDVIVLNHIYEHVVDPVAVLADLRRVLSPEGVIYLGIGHKHQLIEPHYQLPFLSWLPQKTADRYMRLTGKGEQYYEHYYSRAGLRRWTADLDVWDYTGSVLAQPQAFSGGDLIPDWVEKVPGSVVQRLAPAAPTYIWVGFHPGRTPRGGSLRVPPVRVRPLRPVTGVPPAAAPPARD